ncbi:hypothetical protein BJX61DRAFT_198734 [Aspergillus egyptiacus]|nr:hypothetical protein BJX61DRAFT_198734 [Aspergillus egyptiacus]
MSSLPHPQFFCARPDGTLTPLVAVDELPAHISIRGVPRVLSPHETNGMRSLGTVYFHGVYAVDGATPAASRPSSTGTAAHRSRNYDMQSFMNLINDENIPPSQRLALSAQIQQAHPQNWHPSNAPTAASSGWLVPSNCGSSGNASGRHVSGAIATCQISTRVPNMSENPGPRNFKKEYCSYWIRHGECDYAQQGCLYKHEMPMDRTMLERLGLRDIPRWYRERYSIPSLLPNGHGHPRPQSDNTHAWKEDGGLKSIPYPAHLSLGGAGANSGLDRSAEQKPGAVIPVQQQQQQQATVPTGSSQMAYQSLGSSTVSVTQAQTPKTSPGQLLPGNRKFDLRSLDQPGYSNLLYRPSTDNAFEASSKTQHDDLVSNLQSLAVSTPLSAHTEYFPGQFDSTVGAGRSKKQLPKSRKLYEHRSEDTITPSASLLETDSMHAFMNQATASSSGASVTSKTTGSQLASPVADAGHGIDSEPPTRNASPASLAGASPGMFRGRGKDKSNRRTPGLGAIGQKKPYSKRSAGSSEDDMFFHGKH